MKRVAIQGIVGSFHEDAALKYFNEKIEIVECKTFTNVWIVFFDVFGTLFNCNRM